ncbi:MAG: hypothetical protein ACYDIA_13645 [Candidatus Humimicrobiaceae bacterium]
MKHLKRTLGNVLVKTYKALPGTLQARIKAIEVIGKKSTLKDIDLLEKLKKMIVRQSELRQKRQ